MRTLPILVTAACAVVGVALLVAASQAAPQRHAKSAHKAAKAHVSALRHTRLAAKATAAAPTAAGMVVAVDENGGLRLPTAEEMQALYVTPDDALNESGDGLVVEHHANGSVSMNLQGRFASYSVVRMGTDGKLIYGCGTSQAGAMAETFAPGHPAAAPEVK